MQPDPEREREWRERAAELFDSAPTPDGARLEATLASVRARRARARSRRRVAWSAAAAAMLGMAAASAAWWLNDDPAPIAPEPAPAPGIERDEAEVDPSESADDGQREAGAKNEGPIIYRRAQ